MSYLTTAILSGARCVVRSDAPTTPVTDLGQDAGDVLAYNADALRGFFAAITTRGDLVVMGASSLTRLAIGTSGKFLKSNGTDPAWATLSSGDLSDAAFVAMLNAASLQTFTGNLRAPKLGIAMDPSEVLDVTGNIQTTGQFRCASSLADSTAVANAKFRFYSNSSSNWSGVGVDASGHFWLRTGLSADHVFGFSNIGTASFARAVVGLWTGVGDSSGAISLFGGNCIIDSGDNFAYVKTSGSLGAMGLVMNRTLNTIEFITSNTTSATAGSTFTPTSIWTIDKSGNVVALGSLTAAGGTFAAGTITSSTPVQVTQTWNSGGVTFTGFKTNITDTASAAGSLLMDLQVAAASKWKVDKSGNVTAAGNLIGQRGKAGQSIFSSATDANNTSTGETDAMSQTLPAGLFATDADAVGASYLVSSSAAATGQVKVYFGGTVIFDSTSYAIASGEKIVIGVALERESSGTVRCLVTAASSVAGSPVPNITYTSVGSLTLSNTQVLKLTLTSTASNQLTAKMGRGNYFAV